MTTESAVRAVVFLANRPGASRSWPEFGNTDAKFHNYHWTGAPYIFCVAFLVQFSTPPISRQQTTVHNRSLIDPLRTDWHTAGTPYASNPS